MMLHCAIAIPPAPCPWLLHHHTLPNSLTSPMPAPTAIFRRRLILNIRGRSTFSAVVCSARRRVRHEDEEEEEEDEEEYGHNEEIAKLERYSEGARDEALLVKAWVDDEVEVVLVFKGFASRLSGRTASDPSRSVLPERAIIQSIDVVKGPFDPNNVEFLEKGLTWDDFKTRLQ